MNAIRILLLQVAVILVLSRLLRGPIRLIRQPQVIGEMLAGIMLGPSVLGLIGHGVWMNALFPPALMSNLEVLSQLGVILFMFLVGMELDLRLLRGQGTAAMVAAIAGIVVPFLFGAYLALALAGMPESQTDRAVGRLVFSLFFGAAMSITAFPVLARILTDWNLQKSRLGTLALACAALVDCFGWCILAFVLELARLKGVGAPAAVHGYVPTARAALLLGLGYVIVMILIVRPWLCRLQVQFDFRGVVSQNAMVILFLLLIASSMATDAIGIHPVFGAFLLGVIMPRGGRFIASLSGKFEDVTLLFLLPLFFAFTGLRTELGLLNSPRLWLICGFVVLAAIIGKIGGVSLAGRVCRMSWRESFLLASLMNTRGMMELIVLNIGLAFGILSRTLFTMMVLMALATTFMTSPLIHLLTAPRPGDELAGAAAKPKGG